MPVENRDAALPRFPANTNEMRKYATRILLPSGWMTVDGIELMMDTTSLQGHDTYTYIVYPHGLSGDKVMYIAASAVLGIEACQIEPEWEEE